MAFNGLLFRCAVACSSCPIVAMVCQTAEATGYNTECRSTNVKTLSTLAFLKSVLQRHAPLTLQSVWRSSPHLCCRCSKSGPQLEREQRGWTHSNPWMCPVAKADLL